MADRLRHMGDEQLGQALASLGRHLAYPEPDVAAAVVSRLSAQPAARRALLDRVMPRRTVRRAMVLAFALLVLLAGAAVAGRLGLPGLRIIFQPQATPVLPSPPPVGTHLFLGHRTTLERARDQVSFRPEVPRGQHLGPAEVYVSDEPLGGRVSLVYRAHPGLPAARFTGVGALITEFRGSVDEAAVKKLVVSGSKVEFTDVNGEPAFWFYGAPHEIFFVDEGGRPFTDSVRLAGNTLVWVDGDLTLRLECRCSQERAIGIASSVR